MLGKTNSVDEVVGFYIDRLANQLRRILLGKIREESSDWVDMFG
jgi:hypothetical protein